MGLEHLFAGIAQGVGETKLSLEKEKRERAEKDQTQKLQVLTALLSQPGLKPEHRSELFRMALDTASNGDKKITDKMHGLLGPMLQQQGGDGQTGGVRPSPTGGEAQPQPQGGGSSLPPSGLQKLGTSGGGAQQPSLFYSPEEETQQMASRAGAVAGAEANARLPVEVEETKKKLELEHDMKVKEGFQLMGFTPVDPKTGKRTPIYMNQITGQTKYGGEVDPFTSLAVMQEQEVTAAKMAVAREEGIRTVLTGQGLDPATATPEQRKKAETAYSNSILQAQEADTGAKKAGAFRDLAAGQAAGDRSVDRESLELNRQNLEYNRQRDDYNAKTKAISDAVEAVENAKRAASEAYNNAMLIKNHLEARGVSVDPPAKEVEYTADEQKDGLTIESYQAMLGRAQAAISQARNLASTYGAAFKNEVEAGGLENKPGVWPYLKDVRPAFQFSASPGGSLPAMPQKPGAKGTSRKQIDVPDSMMQWLMNP